MRQVEASRFSFGVRSVPRRSEITRVVDRRCAASVVVVAAALASFLLAVPKAQAEFEGPVMAAFLLNFARYVEWPAEAFEQSATPVNFCMMSTRKINNFVSEAISGKKIAGRSIVVRSVSKLSAVTGCHIFFIGSEVDISHAVVVKALSRVSVFSVADKNGFASAGGIANFIHVDNRIRFEINPRAAERAGLRISSRLLRLAKLVE